MFIDIIIYLIVAGLLAVVIARLSQPLNLVVAAIIVLLVLIIALKLFGVGIFSLLLLVWMLLVIGGLYLLRGYVRSGRI
ncbi:hypothetical protein [Lacticaseibacillus sharpeae]|uniref:Uncharacterized protein n=1 Tax=Lacticaseibacillus sharpeae JCM 1186 = DSM 20505 TaxID=1291052 RepID=A0A0R1ZN06_9LACO|nr:hypothetical protein [Lacticaseibacillus sharpeae]KRM56366.1 hypothetical protein FC18_GL000049 [Lacticaseibacillus sharpeae JCM 1186 = DSM 20505]